MADGGARAQPAMPVVGFLSSASGATFTPFLTSFRNGLSGAGYFEGRNVAIEFRWAEGQYERLPALAADLVRRNVAVIVVSGGAVSARAAKEATSTIPILFVIGEDPVKFGLVPSLNRPSGNVTGITLFISALMAKRLELLSDLVPGTGAIVLLVNPSNPNAETERTDMEGAARATGRQLRVLMPAAIARSMQHSRRSLDHRSALFSLERIHSSIAGATRLLRLQHAIAFLPFISCASLPSPAV